MEAEINSFDFLLTNQTEGVLSRCQHHLTQTTNRKTNIMNTYTATEAADIVQAIKRSISHDEIVRVIVPSLEDGEQWVNERSESSDSVETDDATTDKRMIDIWGDDGQGGEFRLYLVTE